MPHTFRLVPGEEKTRLCGSHVAIIRYTGWPWRLLLFDTQQSCGIVLPRQGNENANKPLAQNMVTRPIFSHRFHAQSDTMVLPRADKRSGGCYERRRGSHHHKLKHGVVL